MTTTKTTTPPADVAKSCVCLMAKLNSLGAGIKNIWVADSEFHSQEKDESGLYKRDGSRQVPTCFVFFNPITGQEIRQIYTLGEPSPPCPISVGTDTLFVAFAAQAGMMTSMG